MCVCKVVTTPIAVGEKNVCVDRRCMQRFVKSIPEWKPCDSGALVPRECCTRVPPHKKYTIGGVRMPARKAVYLAFNGALPEDARITHVVRSADGSCIKEVSDDECVNPKHLACVMAVSLDWRSKRDRYADLVASGVDKAAARRVLGISASWARKSFAECFGPDDPESEPESGQVES